MVMNRMITWLKRIRIGQILAVCLAAILMVVSTACSGVSMPEEGGDQGVPSELQGEETAPADESAAMPEQMEESQPEEAAM